MLPVYGARSPAQVHSTRLTHQISSAAGPQSLSDSTALKHQHIRVGILPLQVVLVDKGALDDRGGGHEDGRGLRLRLHKAEHPTEAGPRGHARLDGDGEPPQALRALPPHAHEVHVPPPHAHPRRHRATALGHRPPASVGGRQQTETQDRLDAVVGQEEAGLPIAHPHLAFCLRLPPDERRGGGTDRRRRQDLMPIAAHGVAGHPVLDAHPQALRAQPGRQPRVVQVHHHHGDEVVIAIPCLGEEAGQRHEALSEPVGGQHRLLRGQRGDEA
mmetsp:Transcript_113095/g.316031  ORF Transcript_113095/g.316031 Transcript_113095/m.316031 type:complete len:272 (-) Transcript_113095:91-906(-)